MLKTLEIDIHGMSVPEAKQYLENTLKTANSQIEEIIVIHGSNGGDKLAIMVRKSLKHKRIKQKILSLNGGITTLIIK